MQKSDLHEKQVLLLTDDNPAIEEATEQQLRELTLLPLNIKYQSVERFQKEGAPKGVTLIVTPMRRRCRCFRRRLSTRRTTSLNASSSISAPCSRTRPPPLLAV